MKGTRLLLYPSPQPEPACGQAGQKGHVVGMRQSEDARARADAYKTAGTSRRGQNVHRNGASNNSTNKRNNCPSMSAMEVEKGPTDPTDPVEETSLARSTNADPTQAQMEAMDTPPYLSEMAPTMTSAPDSVEGNREGDLQDMEAKSGEVDGKLPIGNEALEPQETETTPKTENSLPKGTQDVEKESGEVGLIVPAVLNGDWCVFFLVDSPSRERASPKRKQLSPPEGDEATTDQENAFKRHRGSISDRISFPRLPS